MGNILYCILSALMIIVTGFFLREIWVIWTSPQDYLQTLEPFLPGSTLWDTNTATQHTFIVLRTSILIFQWAACMTGLGMLAIVSKFAQWNPKSTD